MNALHTAIRDSSTDKIYGVYFQDDNKGGTTVVYTIDVDLVKNPETKDFRDLLMLPFVLNLV